jgi:hypothetical protein
MTRFRTERVHAGRREAELEWSICPSCRHVRLERWTLSDPATADEEESELPLRGG